MEPLSALVIPPSPLAMLHVLLDQNNFSTFLVSPSEEMPFEQLLIATDESLPESDDTQPTIDPQYVLQLFFADDVLRAERGEKALLEDDMTQDTVILQFMMSLPIHAEDNQMLDLYRLLSVFNRILPIGTFELNEEEQVYLRYGLLVEDKSDITSPQIIEIVELLGFFVNRLVPKMAELVYAGKTLSQVVEETESMLSAAIDLD